MASKLTSLQELVAHQQRMLNVLMVALGDHATAIAYSLPGCHFCEQPATVAHQYTGRQACDRCCAEHIHMTRENDLAWLDLPQAHEVRKIQQHHELSTELDATVH